MKLQELKEKIIKYLNNIKYDDLFCLRFYYLIESSIFMISCKKNYNIYKFNYNYSHLYIIICDDFLNNNEHNDEEKIKLILKDIINYLVKINKCSGLTKDYLNMKKNFYLEKLNINENLTNNFYNIKHEKLNKTFIVDMNFNFNSNLKFIQNINPLEYINLNNHVIPIITSSNINNYKNFKVIERKEYNQNDYILFLYLSYNYKHNKYVIKEILNKYFDFILKHCKINITMFDKIYNCTNKFYLIKIINTLDKEDIVYLINNDYIKDIYWLKNINNEIKKEIILENNIPFKVKVKLTNYMEGNKL